jgi:hypothetical protein
LHSFPLADLSRHADVVRALLDAGADVDATDECVRPAAIISCRNSQHMKLISIAGANNRLCTWRFRLPQMPMPLSRFWMLALTLRPGIRTPPLYCSAFVSHALHAGSNKLHCTTVHRATTCMFSKPYWMQALTLLLTTSEGARFHLKQA